MALTLHTEDQTVILKSGDIISQEENSIEMFGFAVVVDPIIGSTFIVNLEIRNEADTKLNRYCLCSIDDFVEDIFSMESNRPVSRLKDGKQLAGLMKKHFTDIKWDHVLKYLKPGNTD